jgi:hypothetical protein
MPDTRIPSIKEFPMTDFTVLGKFKSITSELQQPIHALGAVKPARDAKDSILRTLCSSLFGTGVTTMFWKDKTRYVAVDDAGVYLLTFKGKDLESNAHYAWSTITNIRTSVDEQFVNIGFGHAGEKISWQILRHQITEPDGTYMTDVEAMKQVGEMTASMEARFKSQAAS